MQKLFNNNLIKIFFSILDQGLFSGSNFLINLALARFLTDNEYGGFSLAFSIFFLFSGLSSSIIIEPMVVLGAKKNKEEISRFVGSSYLMILLLSCLSSVVIVLFSFFQNNITKDAFFSLGLSMPIIMGYWLLRQSCYLKFETHKAFYGSFTYSVILLLGLYFMYNYNLFSVTSGFLLLGISSFIASLLLIITNKIKFNFNLFHKQQFFPFWKYGKWILPASLSNWITSGLFIPVITIVSGLTMAGIFKAMQNFYLPLQQFYSALYLLLLPLLSKNVFESKPQKNKSILIYSIISFVFISIIYIILITIFNSDLLLLIYNKTNYLEFSWILIFIGLTITLIIPGQIFSLYLRAIEKTNTIFIIKLISVVVSIIFGIGLVIYLKFLGILITLILISLAESISAYFFFVKSKKTHAK